AAFGGTGQPPETLHPIHLVLAYQKVETLGVLSDNLALPVLDGFPIQLARAQAVDAVLLRRFHVVVDLGMEQQRFGRDATHVKAGPAEQRVFLDEAGLQAQLTRAKGGWVSPRSSADNGNVVNSLWQGNAPCRKNLRKANI